MRLALRAQAAPMAQPPAGGAPTFTLLPPRPGEPAVPDADFKAFYESLDEFAPTVRARRASMTGAAPGAARAGVGSARNGG